MQYRFPSATAFAAATVLAAVSAAPALSANALASASVQVTPAFQSAGIRVMTTGDDNANATGTVQYRVSGQTAWKPAHPLVRIAPNRLATMLFNINEGTRYDLMVTMADPDGTVAPVSASFTTRVTPQSSTAGRTLYVSPAGSPAPTGAQTAPYGSITSALYAAQPGDTVALLPGTYRERVIDDFRSGLPGAPITIKPAGPGVFLKGDLQKLEDPHATPYWTLQSDGTWSTPVPAQTCYVSVNGTRVYHYLTRADLATALAAGKMGFYQDPTNWTVTLALPGGASPDTMPVQVSQLQEAFLFLNVHDIIVDGLDMGYFGAVYGHCVYLNNSSNITIRNSHLHNATEIVFMKNNCNNNLVERNEINDTAVDTWDWSAVKGSDAEGVAIEVELGGSNNTVRNNHIHNINDAIWTDTGTADNQGDTDVYYNWMHDLTDDGLEPDGNNINYRGWCNTIRTAQNTISLAPAGVGPIWLMYNTVSQFRETGIKVSNNTTGQVRIYQNTVVTTLPGEDAMSPWSPMVNITARNNIFVATRYVIQDFYTTPADNCSFDGDLLMTTDTGRFVKWDDTRYYGLTDLRAGSGQEMHGVSGDPMFYNINAGDFRIQSTSPARHQALIIPGVNDFFGVVPDLGSYQMG